MATTSARALELLTLLGTRRTATDLATRLGVSTRTLRRDIDVLRTLGYPVEATKGRDATYRLAGGKLPPLLFDGDQALAIAVALQTAPATISGTTTAAARALSTIKQIMPAHLRAQAEALHLTTIGNYWDFPAPTVPPSTLTAVGAAIRDQHLLDLEHLTPDGDRPPPAPPARVEPHHLVHWAGRWYLVAHDGDWTIHRLDRIHPRAPTGIAFQRRALPAPDVAHYVMTTADRGDTTPTWPCLGAATLDLPADVVARFAPGGSVVEHLAPGRTRLTLGAWSWAGIAGLLGTFDTDLTDVEPAELTHACHTLAERFRAT
ncbi:Predicted DNA-binding transcriptional regulator YafY, contains an HTH and WYL domains [Amycolatopsis xylanica]|uniref:Predicted DNA-binding transcriptional regulator YafY, contains an HTH and WYL domains n=1 Tax=Amycolatopsis xylanica TaxID=589385 RepID=A0A1H2VMC7_9PSEU|nr:WYL domain-containing protein [Amycolatopsis xylanica]SDW69483.1 Predicted DNA-binding transcriptional regulator YafY, contains an HTH and WYL domains [Amycolatopsis xylanica]